MTGSPKQPLRRETVHVAARHFCRNPFSLQPVRLRVCQVPSRWNSAGWVEEHVGRSLVSRVVTPATPRIPPSRRSPKKKNNRSRKKISTAFISPHYAGSACLAAIPLYTCAAR